MDRKEKLICTIAQAPLLDPTYLEALNADFEKYPDDEYNVIRDYIREKLNGAIATDSNNPVFAALRAHHDISQLIEISFNFVRSKVRRWALDMLKKAINEHDEELEIEKALNAKIIQMFKDSPQDFSETLTEITILLYENCDLVQGIHIATCLYQFGEKIKNSRKLFDMNEYSKEFFNVITHLTKKSKRDFNAQGIGTALYSLQNLPDCEEIRELFDAITDSLEHYKPVMNTQGVGISLYGLQNMHESKELLRLVNVLGKIILERPPTLDARAISQAFFGLQNIIHLDEVQELREYLMQQLNKLDPYKMTDASTFTLIQALRMGSVTVPDNILQHYDEVIFYKSNEGFASRSEEYGYQLATKLFPHHFINHNFYIDGFELDLYLPHLRLNIEIDGEYHGVNSVREDKRDQHLIEKHGISIVRIPIEIMIDENEFRRRIHTTLAAA